MQNVQIEVNQKKNSLSKARAFQSCTSQSTRILVPALTSLNQSQPPRRQGLQCSNPINCPDLPFSRDTTNAKKSATSIYTLFWNSSRTAFYLPILLLFPLWLVSQPLLTPSFHSIGRCSSFVLLNRL